MMFGALVAASSTSLTSCKNYDDDISGLQTQITQNANAIVALQNLAKDGVVITKVEKTAAGVVVTTSNGQTWNLTNGQDGKDADVWTIGADNYWYKNGEKTEFLAQGAKGDTGETGATGAKGDKGDTGATGDYYVPNKETGMFDIYDGVTHEKKGSTDISWHAGYPTVVQTATCVILSNFPGYDGQIVISTIIELKGLVFEPDFYYEGIEALEVATFNYNEKTFTTQINADGNFKTDAPTIASSAFTMAPDLAATYHLNPANAMISKNAADFKFIAWNKNYTRSSENVTSSFVVKSVDLGTKGKVTVHANYQGKSIKDIATDSKVSVLALQYSRQDSVITSDYAAVKANIYKNLVLSNPILDGTSGHNHLYTTAAAAIAADATVQVKYNDEVGIDLRQYVNTHRDNYKSDGVTANFTDRKWDNNAASGTVEKAGFKYSFQLVGWHDGSNATSQSAHAAIADNGYTLRAQMPKDGKQQAYGAEQNRATLDKEPLVRVLLTDTINNKIAAVGYIKVKIVEEVVTPPVSTKYKHIDFTADPASYTIACHNNDIALKTLKWHEVEESIIAQLGISKAKFEELYELEGFTPTTPATQFNTPNESTGEATVLTPQKGVVKRTTTDIAGTETEVIVWNISNYQAYSIFKSNATKIETYVRYALKAGKSATYKYFYVKLTWTPNTININPTTAFGDSNKIKSYWYKTNDEQAGAGYDEIHGNVEVVGTDVAFTDVNVLNKVTSAANDEFVFDIRNTLVGHKASVDALKSPYNTLGTPVVTFTFVTGNGLYANTAGNKLYAESTLVNKVAEIDPISGIVKYADNAKAKELLNKPENSKVIEQSVTATVAVNATVCGTTTAGVNGIGAVNVPVSNNQFKIKFLRPVTVSNATATFEDAATGGSTSNVNITFTDWRNHNFVGDSRTGGHNYFQYYGVKSINVKTNQGKTDINGGKQNLSTVAPNISFTYTAPAGNGTQITANNYGTLKYENNGTTVGTFKVWFPIEVVYDWGTLVSEIECTINKTQNHSRRQ